MCLTSHSISLFSSLFPSLLIVSKFVCSHWNEVLTCFRCQFLFSHNYHNYFLALLCFWRWSRAGGSSRSHVHTATAVSPVIPGPEGDDLRGELFLATALVDLSQMTIHLETHYKIKQGSAKTISRCACLEMCCSFIPYLPSHSLPFPPPTYFFFPQHAHKCCILFCLLIHRVGIQQRTSALAVVIGLVASMLLCQQTDGLSFAHTDAICSLLCHSSPTPPPPPPPLSWMVPSFHFFFFSFQPHSVQILCLS